MFMKLLTEPIMRYRSWEFTLMGNITVVGNVIDYVIDGNGHPIMLQVNGSIGIWDIPWTAIVKVRAY